jgi:hypothetical protein
MNTTVERDALEMFPTLHDVCEYFRSSRYPHLANYVKSVHNGAVVLEGVSASYHSKQLAQNVALRCPGIVRVRNLICVDYGIASVAFG